MTSDELSAVLANLDRDRFTLEDAECHGDEWIAYLFEARSGVTFCVSDYAAYREHYAYLPTTWIAHQPRRQRLNPNLNVGAARLSVSDVCHIMSQERASAWYTVVSLHVRYDENDDDRYVVIVNTASGHLAVSTLAAYQRLQGDQ